MFVAAPLNTAIADTGGAFGAGTVRLSSLVAAFGPQRELEVDDVGAVPRQEDTSEMNLSGESPNEPADQHDARPIH